MSVQITKVEFQLYDLESKDVVKIVEMDPSNLTSSSEGLFVFGTPFQTPYHSSFGLPQNSFGVRAIAWDEVGRTTSIEVGNLPSDVPAENFVTHVRVKEKSTPYIAPIKSPNEPGSGWVSNQASPDFTAYFRCWDQNGKYRVAGIDSGNVILEISNTPEIEDSYVPVDINSPEGNFEIKEYNWEDNPYKDEPNGEGYLISYTFKDLQDGDYAIRATVYDNDGNPAEATGLISIKSVAPELTVSFTPEPTQIQSGYVLTTDTLTVSGNVNSDANINIVVKKDGSIIRQDRISYTELSNLAFSKTYVFSEEGEGEYEVSVNAENVYNSNTVSSTITKKFYMDLTAPKFFSVKIYPDMDSDTPINLENGLIATNYYAIRIEVE